MPIDPYIAQGVAPIGRDLPEIANMLYRRDTADREMANREQYNALLGKKFDAEQQQQRSEQEMMQRYAEMEAYAGDPALKAQYVEIQKRQHPEFANTPFASLPPDQAFDAMRRGLQARLGKADDAARLQQQQSQFDARLGLDRQQFEADQKHRSRQLSLQEAQERRLSGGGGGYRPLTPDQVKALGLPDGTVAQVSPEGKIDIVNKPPQQALTPKDASSAQTKLRQIGIARKQLALVREKFAALGGTFSSGIGGGYLPTEKGKAADAAVNSMRDTLTSLTRVPGIGAMSDFETRLAQAKFPDRGQYESVSAQQIQSIEDLLTGLESGYRDMLGEAAAPEAPSGAPKPGDLVKGYRFKGGDPSKQENWVKQ